MIQEFLPYISIALQWARARSRFKEIWYALIVVGASFLFYVMADPTPFHEPWQQVLAGWWEQAKLILALTQATSTLSNIAVDAKVVKADNAMVPVTDSKT